MSKERAPRKNGLRYIPLDPSVWLLSESVSGMSLAAQGLYVRLLCRSWLNGPLPTDPRRLAALTNVRPEEFKKIWPEIKGLWIIKRGGLVNERLQTDYRAAFEKLERKRKQASEAGKKSAAAKGNEPEEGRSTDVERSFDGRSTPVNDINKAKQTNLNKKKHHQETDDVDLVAIRDKLIEVGVDRKVADDLAIGYPKEAQQQLLWLPYRLDVENRAAYIVAAIKNSYTQPSNYDNSSAKELPF